VLRLPGETTVAWAVFDADWYRRTYPAAPNGTPAALLAFYIDHGQALGHSPNRLFDEAWHRTRYPSVAAAVTDGEYTSAFDAYCRRGGCDRSAHWLFDELFYRHRHPDLTDTVLANANLANGFDHYLRHGVEEDRSGHLLFDAQTYLDNFDPIDAQAIRRSGVFQHYVARIETAEPELRTSLYFDHAWYLRRYPEVARAVQAGHWKCALHHYLCNDHPQDFDPSEHFSEQFYLDQDAGLRDAIAKGHFRNGYAHFLLHGAQELRRPTALLDLKLYAEQPKVKADLAQGSAPDGFTHWLRFASKPEQALGAALTMTDQQARISFLQTALALVPIAARARYSFDPAAATCSVVMTTRDTFVLTLAALAALQAATGGMVAPIVIDRGSTDETRAIDQYVTGVRVVRLDDGVGQIDAANAGWQLATTPFVLFLAADARLAPGALRRAIARLTANPALGAVAGMLIQPNGSIGQAGGIVWSDGGLHDYQRGEPPSTPEATFVRTVDFGSLACLLVRRTALETLDGLDAGFASGHAAADLGLRLADAGMPVVYDPSLQAMHDDTAVADTQAPEAFRHRHSSALRWRQQRGGWVQVFARHAGAFPKRVLVFDDTIPLRRLGSGFVRSNDIVHALAALGCYVTVYPINGCPHDPAHVLADLPETAEAMYTHSAERLTEFLEARRHYYDTIWVCRLHNLRRIAPVLAKLRDNGLISARVILDTEAITPTREALQARLAGRDFDLEAAMSDFTAVAATGDAVVAVTDAEAALLQTQGLPNVCTVGHMIAPQPTRRPFTARNGLLFVGAIHTSDSPNYDSLVWFTEAVLPLLAVHLGAAARLTIAGYVAPGVDLGRFETNPRITTRGPVADLTPLYDRHRLFIAPTRYAAGAPYKVLEAAARGLPVVATTLLAEELGWTDGAELATAAESDAAAFAARIAAIYADETSWTGLRETALQRLARDHGQHGFLLSVSNALARAETNP